MKTKTYAITLEQLAALADFISNVDGPGYNEACSEAHQIVCDVLGQDEPRVYSPPDGSEVAA
jgi:hypothetical protein